MDPVIIYILGPAGCGKSTFTGNFYEWMINSHYDAGIINLDPGAELLPYTPNFDIKEIVSTSELMETEKLGPNGAQIAAADIMAMHAADIREKIEDISAPYVLVDTPGQMELFVYRNSGPHIVNNLNRERSASVYIFDPFLISKPEHFISAYLLHKSVHFRLGLPMINILGKSDMVEDKIIDRIVNWVYNPNMIYDELISDSINKTTMERELAIEITRAIENTFSHHSIIPVSNVELSGMEDVYSDIQNIFFFGEDLVPE